MAVSHNQPFLCHNALLLPRRGRTAAALIEPRGFLLACGIARMEPGAPARRDMPRRRTAQRFQMPRMAFLASRFRPASFCALQTLRWRAKEKLTHSFGRVSANLRTRGLSLLLPELISNPLAPETTCAMNVLNVGREDSGAKVLLVRLNKHHKTSSARIALLIVGIQQSNDDPVSIIGSWPIGWP
ncbi:hypothetical protein [Paraburkholderia sp. 40]|uniref:hypothetical protein n=1 Tax=Paraburkholderia sp. 40 TaxID=2991059 RepID=UPI003D240728